MPGASELVDPDRDVPQREWSPRREGAWYLLVAIVFALIAAGLWYGVEKPRLERARRSEQAAAERVARERAARERAGRERAQEATPSVTPADHASLATFPTSFRWTPPPGATKYKFVLSGRGASSMFVAPDLESHAIRVRVTDLPFDVMHGGQFVWEVQLQDVAGDPKLGPFFFEVRSPDADR